MSLKTLSSVIVTLLIAAAVGVYLFALNNRYKEINGEKYFDIRTGKTVEARPVKGDVVVDYPLLKTQYKIEGDGESK